MITFIWIVEIVTLIALFPAFFIGFTAGDDETRFRAVLLVFCLSLVSYSATLGGTLWLQ